MATAEYFNSTVKTIEPAMTKNGFHRAFDTDGGKMYVFNVLMENGDTGQTGSKSVESRYKAGDKVKYTKKEGPKGVWISIKEKEGGEGAAGGTRFKSTYNDPISIRKQAMIIGNEIASLAYKSLGKEPTDLKTKLAYGVKFYNWIMEGVDTDSRDGMYNRAGCLRRAFEDSMDFKSLGIMEMPEKSRLQAILDMANEILTMVNSIQAPEDGKAF